MAGLLFLGLVHQLFLNSGTSYGFSPSSALLLGPLLAHFPAVYWGQLSPADESYFLNLQEPVPQNNHY